MASSRKLARPVAHRLPPPHAQRTFPRPSLASLLATLALASCQLSGASLAHKARSFAPVADHVVDGVPITEFLRARTVQVLIGGEPTEIEGVYHAGVAVAVPISDDGYMLTAAHALGGNPMALRFRGERGDRPMRVVWSGFDGKGDCDLALIHAVPPDGWFEFAPDVALEEGLRVVAAGFSDTDLAFSSGTLTRAFERVDGPATQVRHSAPLRDGDSGGPLIALDGRLVAVNFGSTTLPIVGQLVSKAMRPDLAWLADVIERDRRDAARQARAR